MATNSADDDDDNTDVVDDRRGGDSDRASGEPSVFTRQPVADRRQPSSNRRLPHSRPPPAFDWWFPRAANRLQLTSRQTDVVRLAISGTKDVSIAAELGMSYDTVRTHLKEVYAKLGIQSKFELTARVYGEGMKILWEHAAGKARRTTGHSVNASTHKKSENS